MHDHAYTLEQERFVKNFVEARFPSRVLLSLIVSFIEETPTFSKKRVLLGYLRNVYDQVFL